MKKRMSILCILLVTVLIVLPLCTSAVNEGNKLFVDPIEDNSTLYYEKSDMLRYELNIDTGNTLYVKVDEDRSPSTTEYIVYQMRDSIVNVEIDCMHCAGLGNGNTDISVFVSKDNANWVEVETAATEQTFDDEIYISQDTAYWFLSTVYNVEPIEPGYTAALMGDNARLETYMTLYLKIMKRHAYPLYNADAARVCMAAQLMLERIEQGGNN